MEKFFGLGLYSNNCVNKVVISAEKLTIIIVVIVLTLLNISALNKSARFSLINWWAWAEKETELQGERDNYIVGITAGMTLY